MNRDIYSYKGCSKRNSILFCWLTMSEADSGGMAEETEPFHYCSIKFYLHSIERRRGAVWQNGVWHECWWYGSRGWSFPPIFHYIWLPCDRWQQRGTLTEWHLTWKYIWSRSVSLNSAMQKKMQLLTLISTYWMFIETKQCMWAQWHCG